MEVISLQVYKWLNQVFQISSARYKMMVNYVTESGSTINKHEEATGPWAAILGKCIRSKVKQCPREYLQVFDLKYPKLK